MRCRPGDLAVIVSAPSLPENIGKLVRVVEPGRKGAPWWRVKALQPMAAWSHGGRGPKVIRPAGHIGVIQDHRLRPLRDQPGEDEMLRIADKPEQVPA